GPGVAVAARAGVVGADEVAGHDVAGGAGAADLSAVVAVAGDDVAGAGGRASDRVVGGGGSDDHALVDVAQRARPGQVGADEVALDDIVRGVAELQGDAEVVVAGDDVAGRRRGAANRIARRVDADAAVVAQGGRARSVGADKVPGHEAPGRPGEEDPVVEVAGDDVARAGDGAADRVGAGAAEDGHPVDCIRQGRVSGGVGADVVALHDVADRPVPLDVDATETARETVARNDVPGRRRGAADRVVGGPIVQHDALVAVADGKGAGEVGADQVALHHVAGGACDIDADAGVAGDDVAGAGCRAADGVVARPRVDADAVLAVGHVDGAVDVGAD